MRAGQVEPHDADDDERERAELRGRGRLAQRGDPDEGDERRAGPRPDRVGDGDLDATQHEREQREGREVRDGDERAGKYHLYLTNIPADRLDAEDIARTYRARWLVELAFRELKAQYRLDQMPSSKRHVVEALLYAAFIAFMVSRALVERIRRLLPGEDHHRLREERWAVVFASAAVDLLALVLRRGRAASTAEPYVERMIRREAIDPNKTRVGLLAFAQAAVLQSGATA